MYLSALLTNRATTLYFACVLDWLIGFVPSHIPVAKLKHLSSFDLIL